MAIKPLFCIFRVDLTECVRFETIDVVEEVLGVGTRRRKDMYATNQNKGSTIITESVESHWH